MTRRVNHLSDTQKAILAKAYKNDFRLVKPEAMSARMWMSHLAQLTRRGLIMREGYAPIISRAGITALGNN